MTARYVLGIDVGTTALKAIALERERGIVAQAELPHELLSPHPGWAEEDPARWWVTTVEAIRELLKSVPAESIESIGVSGMVPALLVLDASGEPLRPSIQQNDARAISEVEELRASVDLAEFLRVTGGTPNQQNIDTKWRWLQRHEPPVIERAAHVCGSYDYLAYRLTGHFSLEENWAAESGFYDVVRHRWHLPYLEHAGFDPALLPPVHKPVDVVAGVSEGAARATGLRAGTPVVAGSADHVAAALAAGLTQSGDILLKFGGAGDILYCDARPDPDPHFYFDYHDIPGLTLINGCMASSGSLVKWFSRELAGGAAPRELDDEARAIEPGAGGIIALPYFLGEKTPIFDPAARGVFAGVMLHHTRAHLYRAILEAVCYGFAHHLRLLREAGRPVRRVVAADGGSRSALWMQIAADVVDLPVQVVAGEAASALGAAFVAGMGAGMFDDWGEITRFISQGPTYSPQQAAVARYRTGFALYRELYARLQTYLPELARLDS
ncbi:MAG TPA: FGGY-family carbohydrate kinase [Steroidobacteraceae bacterium]|nr:FGGY-family carbohydrate kinase [Steroidobacteraceae bacterium]